MKVVKIALAALAFFVSILAVAAQTDMLPLLEGAGPMIHVATARRVTGISDS